MTSSNPIQPIPANDAEQAAWKSLALTMRAIRQASLDPADFRLIGGAMVTLHVMRSGLGLPLRATADSDIALPMQALIDSRLDVVLDELFDYRQGGNRWVSKAGGLEATVDVLVSASVVSDKPLVHEGRQFDQAPNLALAMRRPALMVDVLIENESITVSLPDVLSGLALKLGARKVRSDDKDLEDIWRLLEVAQGGGIGPKEFQETFVPTTNRPPMHPFLELRRIARNPNLTASLTSKRTATRLRQLALLFTSEPV